MLLTHRKQASKELLKDVSRAASRIADESRAAAGTARSELGGLGSELRDQASETLTQARKATAARLASAADTVQPARKRRHRGLRLLVPAVLGGIVAAKVAKLRRERALADSDDEIESRLRSGTASTPTSASTATSPKRQGTEPDESDGKSQARKSAATSNTARSASTKTS